MNSMPDLNAHGRLMIGLELVQKRYFEEALPWLDQAIAQMQEDMRAALCNRAVALGELGRADEALSILYAILRNDPLYHVARLNLGHLLMQVQRHEDAITNYDMLIDNPDVEKPYEHAARFGRGFCNLVLGNLRDGFVDFEYRKKMKLPPRSTPEWTGKQPLDGKTILIVGEMGHGDNIMFLRYVPMLRKCGAKVIAAVPSVMQPLAATLPGLTLQTKDEAPKHDYWVRMMSLAHCFGTDVDTCPPPAPYQLPLQLKAKWKSGMLMGEPRLRVGLCWSGSRESQYDRVRNIPLRELAPLFEIPGVEFYSLQLDIRDTDKAAFDEMDIFDVGSKVKNFLDTACVIAGLDLVITVDTSVAHLAGTVGVKTWVMLTSYRTYWLWIRGRTDNPWYPSATCFRQPHDGDWKSVVAVLRARLSDFVQQGRSQSAKTTSAETMHHVS